MNCVGPSRVKYPASPRGSAGSGAAVIRGSGRQTFRGNARNPLVAHVNLESPRFNKPPANPAERPALSQSRGFPSHPMAAVWWRGRGVARHDYPEI